MREFGKAMGVKMKQHGIELDAWEASGNDELYFSNGSSRAGGLDEL